MATGVQRRTRWERVAALELPPGRWEQAWAGLRRGDVLLRIGLCVLAALLVCIVIRGWYPPFTYRAGQVLLRDTKRLWIRVQTQQRPDSDVCQPRV